MFKNSFREGHEWIPRIENALLNFEFQTQEFIERQTFLIESKSFSTNNHRVDIYQEPKLRRKTIRSEVRADKVTDKQIHLNN